MEYINKYDFFLGNNKFNLLKMMVGEQKFSRSEHLNMTWVSFKNIFGLASDQELDAKSIYDDVLQITSTASKCFSLFQISLPPQKSDPNMVTYKKGMELVTNKKLPYFELITKTKECFKNRNSNDSKLFASIIMDFVKYSSEKINKA